MTDPGATLLPPIGSLADPAGNERALLVGVIPGLQRERYLLEALSADYQPSAVGIAVAPEDLQGLIALFEDPSMDPPLALTTQEVLYAEHLRTFGQVRLPPPCFSAAVRIARSKQLALLPLDMDHPLHTRVFTTHVRTSELWRTALRTGRLRRKHPKEGEDALQWCRRWDAAMTRTRGYRAVEEHRERFIAEATQGFAQNEQRLLAVIEAPRLPGVLAHLRSHPQDVHLDEEAPMRWKERLRTAAAKASAHQQDASDPAQGDRVVGSVEEELG